MYELHELAVPLRLRLFDADLQIRDVAVASVDADGERHRVDRLDLHLDDVNVAHRLLNILLPERVAVVDEQLALLLDAPLDYNAHAHLARVVAARLEAAVGPVGRDRVKVVDVSCLVAVFGSVDEQLRPRAARRLLVNCHDVLRADVFVRLLGARRHHPRVAADHLAPLHCPCRIEAVRGAAVGVEAGMALRQPLDARRHERHA